MAFVFRLMIGSPFLSSDAQGPSGVRLLLRGCILGTLGADRTIRLSALAGPVLRAFTTATSLKHTFSLSGGRTVR